MSHSREAYSISVGCMGALRYFRTSIRRGIWIGLIRFIFCIGWVAVLGDWLLAIIVYFGSHTQPALQALLHISTRSSILTWNDRHPVIFTFPPIRKSQHYSSCIPMRWCSFSPEVSCTAVSVLQLGSRQSEGDLRGW